jgi:hypothetical protein
LGRLGGFRLELEELLERLDCLVEILEPDRGQAGLVMGRGVVRLEGYRFLEGGQGLLILSQLVEN